MRWLTANEYKRAVRIEALLARLEYVNIIEFVDIIRISAVAVVAQAGERLPEKRVQFKRSFIRFGGNITPLSCYAHLRQQLIGKAGDVTKIRCNSVQMLERDTAAFREGNLDICIPSIR